MEQTAFEYALQDPLVITILVLCLVVFITVLSILVYLFFMQPNDQFIKSLARCPFQKLENSESSSDFLQQLPNSYLYAYNCNYPGPPKALNDDDLPDYEASRSQLNSSIIN